VGFDMTLVMLAVALVVVGCGLGAIRMGLLIPYLLIAAPAFVATWHQQRQVWKPASTIVTFFASAASISLALVGVMLGMFLACGGVLTMFCGRPMNLH
jgi:hypothetical protein